MEWSIIYLDYLLPLLTNWLMFDSLVFILTETSHNSAVSGECKENKTDGDFNGISEGSEPDDTSSFEVLLSCECQVGDGEGNEGSGY